MRSVPGLSHLMQRLIKRISGATLPRGCRCCGKASFRHHAPRRARQLVLFQDVCR